MFQLINSRPQDIRVSLLKLIKESPEGIPQYDLTDIGVKYGLDPEDMLVFLEAMISLGSITKRGQDDKYSYYPAENIDESIAGFQEDKKEQVISNLKPKNTYTKILIYYLIGFIILVVLMISAKAELSSPVKQLEKYRNTSGEFFDDFFDAQIEKYESCPDTFNIDTLLCE